MIDRPATSNPLKRAVRKLLTDHEELDSRELADTAATSGATAMGSCGDRIVVTVCGRVRSLTLRPLAGAPSLEAEIYDGSGAVTLVWLGRSAVAAVNPGCSIRATGRVGIVDGRRTIFNPRYELLSEA